MRQLSHPGAAPVKARGRPARLSLLHLLAQNKESWGSVTCEILVDGERRTTSTSTGAYVIAECSNAAEQR